MPGYFIYCRKSSEAEDRQVLSIESQTRELEEIAARLNLPIAEILTESRSAKEPGRPVFNQLMQRLYRGEAAGILCWKLDRLARNPVDGGSIIWAIKQHGIKVLTPAQSYAREDDNILLMYIEFGMAQKYVDDLSKNVKRGLKTKTENGWYPGVAPAGYLNHTDPLTGENTLIKDPERFPLLRRMWDLMLSGQYSPQQILALANQEWGFRTRPTRKMGGRQLCRSAIYQIFNKPFYYGRFEYPKGSGQHYQGKHEPMITQNEYEQVQSLLHRTNNPRPQLHPEFAFTGLIHCGACTQMVTAEEKHQLICSACKVKFAYRTREACPGCALPIENMVKPLFLHYSYYHCSKSKRPMCPQKCVRNHELEKQIDDYLARIEISQKFKEWAIKYLHELNAKESASQKDILQSQQKALQECLKRLENLVKLKTSSGNGNGSLLSDEEYGQQRLEALHEKATLERLLREAGTGVDECLRLCEKTFEFAATVRSRFAQGDARTKKEILVTIGSNLILIDKKLCIEARKPFLILEKPRSGEEPENEAIEPEKNGVAQSRKEAEDLACPGGLGDLDEVRTFRQRKEQDVKALYHFFQSFRGLPYEFFPSWLNDELSTDNQQPSPRSVKLPR